MRLLYSEDIDSFNAAFKEAVKPKILQIRTAVHEKNPVRPFKSVIFCIIKRSNNV